MKLNLDAGPLVVGVLSSLDGDFLLAGDVVEVRLDKTGCPPDWLEQCKAIEARGKPVLLTVRLRSEGGEWPNDDEGRLQIYEQGLPALSAVDVELSSVICAAVTKQAERLGKVCLVSHHDFAKTPPLAELESIVERAQQNGAVAKIATMIRSEADVDTLRSLLSRRGKQPLCVIGMGNAWKQTRVSFPKLGSCLTYGYLDQPTAPGQVSAAELVRQLREHLKA
ncbi:MAG: type I 3-dehydroquinate dehydratase [Verrucomicrobiota bacterium]